MTDTKTSVSLRAPDDLARLREEYDMADKVMKQVQAFVDEAGIPAINELRYAGYHLLNAVIPANEKSSPQDELIRATNHCKRATYEACEMGMLTAFDKISMFKTDYSQVVVSQIVPDWQQILTKCDQCRDEITSARQTGDDRSIDHTRFRDSFTELVNICRRLDHARDDLNKLIEAKRTEARRYAVNVFLAIVGIAVAVGFGISALL